MIAAFTSLQLEFQKTTEQTKWRQFKKCKHGTNQHSTNAQFLILKLKLLDN